MQFFLIQLAVGQKINPYSNSVNAFIKGVYINIVFIPNCELYILGMVWKNNLILVQASLVARFVRGSLVSVCVPSLH